MKNNDRIAQILLARCERINWQEREEIDKGEGRQDQGFGHTGIE